MDRRQFLRLFAATLITPALGQCSRQLPVRQHLTSKDGLLELDLTAQSQKLAGRRDKMLAYNGQTPGPILEAKVGDTVRLTLHNRLDAPTNLHYHGLHISPEIDNVFREVPIGESYTYEFQIPNNHPAVTGWYHPHYHLNVAHQVFGGLAGPLLIRGDLDEIPEIQAAEEAVLILQDVGFDKTGIPLTPDPLGRMWGREGKVLLVNGQQNPTVKLRQNGLLRLRLINASASRIYRLQLQEHPWFLMATDRGSIAEPTELGDLILSPGERAELLISGSRTPGTYKLMSLPYDRGTFEMMAAMGPAVNQVIGVAKPVERAIATLQYEKSDLTEALPLPQRLIPPEPLPEPDISRKFVLNHGIDPTAGSTGFIINDQSFVIGRVNTRVRLGAVEDWEIVNKASMDHPFHLHTNRFQVISRNGEAEALRAWKDTIAVGGYETVKIRVRFDDFTGTTVYHCHILDHEDQGMMGIIEIT